MNLNAKIQCFKEMTTIRGLRITKRSRGSPVPDVPINFNKLENLHLELLEVKSKLKPGLPLIPKSKPVLAQQSNTNQTPPETERKGKLTNQNPKGVDTEEVSVSVASSRSREPKKKLKKSKNGNSKVSNKHEKIIATKHFFNSLSI